MQNSSSQKWLIGFCTLINLGIPAVWGEITGYQVDSTRRIFADSPSEACFLMESVSVPRNANIPFQFVVKSDKEQSATLHVNISKSDKGKVFKGSSDVYQVLDVNVEANSNTGGTQIGKPALPPYKSYLIRKAPFYAAEALVNTSRMNLKKNKNNVILCDLKIASNCEPGLYRGKLIIESEKLLYEIQFEFTVFDVAISDNPALKTSHWLSTIPTDLVSSDAPVPWSEKHWQAIKNSGILLHQFGDRVVTVDTFYSEDPMVQTIIKEDGDFDFDFSKFDRWMNLFLEIGYERIEGVAVSGHWISPTDNLFALDAKKNKVLLFKKGFGLEKLADFEKQYSWPESRDKFSESLNYKANAKKFSKFLEAYFVSLYAHLKEKGWLNIYVQQLLDEPRAIQDYAYMSERARICMPGVKIGNAIHAYGIRDYEKFSPLVDIWVMEMDLLQNPKSRDIIKNRINQNLETGIYVLGRGSSWPNRLLDRPLLDNRIQPWIFFLYGLESYIHWAANQYRGADPYKTSVGPLPGGSQTPGHPPGNNWIFYPSPKGLIPSMRAIVFREGLVDYSLLKMLQKKDSKVTDEILKSVVRNSIEYNKDPQSYHYARRKLLEILAGQNRDKAPAQTTFGM